MKTIITNPKIRCIHCQGRLVLEIEQNSISSNLVNFGENYVCKDKQECNRNITSENTIINFSIDKQGKIKSNSMYLHGKPIIEILENGRI